MLTSLEYWIPRLRVWSPEIGERFEGGEIAKAFKAGPIVVGDKAVKEGVAIGVANEGAPRAAAFGFPADGFGDAAVERSTRPLVCGRYGLVRR